ncbi:hypothetical protein [Kineococcus radiotolerans]|uniref:Uncharacterized protein n=1 Tax=Kineococcus radiotolerans (strain ATCC BAA-149 / DSM 14245 / SRS30216) TaxID=266940 RepID=A6WAM1_KINRD|nr:hypothetical protein [Kineococcus radiotolerans]ABS03860.1 conserved hypothetical protein [Kineococcus radiotolerans SRS30216 = ATCC BAA-149]
MDPLYRARARAHLGDLPPEQMPDWAAHALARGYDSPALRELAGAPQDPRARRDLLTTALDELGAPQLSDHQALWVMAHTHARSIVEGLISPEEGAELIWGISSSLGDPEELNGLLNEATDWEYSWEIDHDQSRRQIIEYAHELLSSMTLDTLDKRPDPDRFMTLDDEASTPSVQT